MNGMFDPLPFYLCLDISFAQLPSLTAPYIVGTNPNAPANPHSAMASGGNDISNIDTDPETEAYVLYGAVVGGPDPSDKFWDIRSDWVETEVRPFTMFIHPCCPLLIDWWYCRLRWTTTLLCSPSQRGMSSTTPRTPSIPPSQPDPTHGQKARHATLRSLVPYRLYPGKGKLGWESPLGLSDLSSWD